jgi:hypothetical protein
MKKVKVAWFSTGIVALLGIFTIGTGQPPKVLPGERYPTGEAKANGYHVINRGTLRTLGLTIEEMDSLIYEVDELPGFEVLPNKHTGNHTCIWVDLGGNTFNFPLVSYITRDWYRQQLNPNFLDFLTIDLEVRESKGEALRVLRARTKGEYARDPWSEGSFSGVAIGDECYRYPDEEHIRVNRLSLDNLYSIHLNFVIGRVKVRVWLSVGMTGEESRRREKEVLQGLRKDYVEVGECEPADIYLLEALALGLEYRIRAHPKRLVSGQEPITVLVNNQPVAQGRTVSLAGVTVAPLSTLEPAQVVLETKRTKTEWTVTARRNGQWVKVKAFSWEMETDKGKVKLERPVFPYKGELVVPLRQVAEALGISVQQKGQTIALLPK